MALCDYLYERIKKEISSYDGNYLEIGAYDGSGVASIAKNITDKNFYVIDPFIEDGNTRWKSSYIPYEKMPSVRESFIKNTHQFNNIKLFEQTTEEFAKTYTDNDLESLNVSMVLIDGDHHTNFVIIDYDVAMKLIGKKSGFIIFDDIHDSQVKTAFDMFLEKYSDRILKIDHYYISGMFVGISKI